MGNDVEVLDDFRRRNLPIRFEIVGDCTRKLRPFRNSDRPRRPAVVSRVYPAIPERERDVKLAELRRSAFREPMLDRVEAATDGIVLLCIVSERILSELRHQSIASFSVVHHASLIINLRPVRRWESRLLRLGLKYGLQFSPAFRYQPGITLGDPVFVPTH